VWTEGGREDNTAPAVGGATGQVGLDQLTNDLLTVEVDGEVVIADRIFVADVNGDLVAVLATGAGRVSFCWH
jgi:hypothetical protein